MNTRLVAATLTPFDFMGQLDLDLLGEHIRWLYDAGVRGFAPTGTTGEFLYLNWDERRLIHRAVLEASADAIVIPCVWDPEPHRARELARHAADEGAHAVFLPPPLYHEVSEDHILQWYDAVVEDSSIPVWAYHHPRTHNHISSELFGRLLGVGIQGLKDSSGSAARVHTLCHAYPGKVWVGGEAMLPRLGVLTGAAGHISRLANLYPELACQIARDGLGEAANRWLVLDREIRAMGGLAVVKRRLGMGCRLPILPPTDLDLDSIPHPGFPVAPERGE